MKALALLTAAALSLLSVAASAQTYSPYGKGKAPPPPPVVTKGQCGRLGGPAIVPVPFFLGGPRMSAFGGKADIEWKRLNVR